MEHANHSPLRRIAFIGNYLPRRCGIATFTTDLCEAMSAEYPDLTCFAVPVNDTPNGYAYPRHVRFELDEQDVTSYRRAADFLNINHVDLVCLQHEYGIFGGPAGSHVLALLRELRVPVVTTPHTVLRDPEPGQRKVMEEIAQLSDRLVVMSQRGSEFLQEIYRVPPDKIDFIPHGIPDVPFVDPNFFKDQFGVEGRLVLLTFGLLSPNKGIEHVIEALPAILARHPNVVYQVLGATHPHVQRDDGEAYRLSLEHLVHTRGVDEHVLFYNCFVSLPELVEFIGAADIYVTPYLNPAQIISGTLSYSVGAGKAVVSTPYWYAEELLAEGRGALVPFRDPGAIAACVTDLLDNEAERHAMRKRGYLLGRDMIWPKVAQHYRRTFERALEGRRRRPRPASSAKSARERGGELPPLKLDHLRHMTDDTGILQHALYIVPNYDEGYTTDDNARALVVTTLLEDAGGDLARDVRPLTSRYLAFLWHAFNRTRLRFRNFMAYDRRWLEEAGSEDSHGRALWALGSVAGRTSVYGFRDLASRLFNAALPAVLAFNSPRAWAFTLIGIHEYLRRFAGDRVAQQTREDLAERLMDLYRRTRSPEWPWFEDVLSYANGRLPQALLLCGQWMARSDMAEAGLESLAWLVRVQCAEEGHFMPIGSNGFYRRGGERARFDQQPIEATALIAACLQARWMTGDGRWYAEARNVFKWFLGRNDLRLPLYDPSTGGCRDGLHPDRANQNQGAESTLCFLLAWLEMHLADNLIRST